MSPLEQKTKAFVNSPSSFTGMHLTHYRLLKGDLLDCLSVTKRLIYYKKKKKIQ